MWLGDGGIHVLLTVLRRRRSRPLRKAHGPEPPVRDRRSALYAQNRRLRHERPAPPKGRALAPWAPARFWRMARQQRGIIPPAASRDQVGSDGPIPNQSRKRPGGPPGACSTGVFERGSIAGRNSRPPARADARLA